MENEFKEHKTPNIKMDAIAPQKINISAYQITRSRVGIQMTNP